MLTFKSSAIVQFEFLHVIWSDFTWHKTSFLLYRDWIWYMLKHLLNKNLKSICSFVSLSVDPQTRYKV